MPSKTLRVGQPCFLEVFSNLNKNCWFGLVCYDNICLFSSICNDCNCKAYVICNPRIRALLFAISEPQAVHFYSCALFLVYLAHPWLTCGHAMTCFSGEWTAQVPSFHAISGRQETSGQMNFTNSENLHHPPFFIYIYSSGYMNYCKLLLSKAVDPALFLPSGLGTLFSSETAC